MAGFPAQKGRYEVAVLIDGGHLLYELAHPRVGGPPIHPTAQEIVRYAGETLLYDTETLFRIFFYDCPPYGESRKNPITGRLEYFSRKPIYARRKQLHENLKRSNYVAFRKGILKFKGWTVKEKQIGKMARDSRKIRADDIKADFSQKRVDMKIGLDVAWLASNQIVDKIILVSGDTDFIPAMKFARREGVQVIVARLHDRFIASELREHCDELRIRSFPDDSC